MRVEISKDQKINIENIINLKKKADVPRSTKNKIVRPYYTPLDENDKTLIFESRFESGNLLAAFKISENYYQLVVQNDTNTNGYSQWFFYRVTGGTKGQTVYFNIINLMKEYSLFNKGMKVSIYSEKKAEIEKKGWHKGGSNIEYYRNSLFKYVREQRRFLSSLSFSYEFEHDNDIVYFANTVPYTYTDLFKELNDLQKNDSKYNFLLRKTLCTTLAGNNLDYLTITSNDYHTYSNNQNYATGNENNIIIKNSSTKAERQTNFNMLDGLNLKSFLPNSTINSPHNQFSKIVIILMARVHPGETVSSYMMKGVTDFLCSDCDEANILRNYFIFKIVPMMNPDGVVCGNYRTSLAGCDLNRRWINPNETLHPEIYSAKQMIMKLSTQKQIGLICDFHGHSGANNIFMYGNPIKEDLKSTKVFPMMLSKISDTFSYEQSKFKLNKNKYGTARINLFHELSITNIFTIEASFYGIRKEGIYKDKQFGSSILTAFGRDVCITMLIYFIQIGIIKPSRIKEIDTNSPNRDKTLFSILKMNEESLFKEIEAADNKSKHEAEMKIDDSDASKEDSVSGSDSEPSLDNFDNDQLVKLLPSFVKKKKKSKKKTKKISFSVSKTKQKLSLDSNKEKISIITNIEVNINQNSNTKLANPNNNLNIITNLNINPSRPVSNRKPQIINSPSPIVPNQTIVKFNSPPIINLKPLDGAGIFGNKKILQMSHKIIDKISKETRKRDMETQTEEIFFKINNSPDKKNHQNQSNSVLNGNSNLILNNTSNNNNYNNIINNNTNLVINVNNNNYITNNNKNNLENFLKSNQPDSNKKELNASLGKSNSRFVSNGNIQSNQFHHNHSLSNVISNKNSGILQFNKIRGLPTSQGSNIILNMPGGIRDGRERSMNMNSAASIKFFSNNNSLNVNHSNNISSNNNNNNSLNSSRINFNK